MEECLAKLEVEKASLREPVTVWAARPVDLEAQLIKSGHYIGESSSSDELARKTKRLRRAAAMRCMPPDPGMSPWAVGSPGTGSALTYVECGNHDAELFRVTRRIELEVETEAFACTVCACYWRPLLVSGCPD